MSFFWQSMIQRDYCRCKDIYLVNFQLEGQGNRFQTMPHVFRAETPMFHVYRHEVWHQPGIHAQSTCKMQGTGDGEELPGHDMSLTGLQNTPVAAGTRPK